MRNFPILLAALGGLTAFVMPAAAEADHGSCGTSSVTSPSGPIDLEAIPMNAAGPKAIKSVGDGECEGNRTAFDGNRTEGKELGDGDD